MAYFTNWYYLPHKTALGMVLIISRSRFIIKITAGKLINLSLMTFGDVSRFLQHRNETLLSSVSILHRVFA